jgi:hypothetical protein
MVAAFQGESASRSGESVKGPSHGLPITPLRLIEDLQSTIKEVFASRFCLVDGTQSRGLEDFGLEHEVWRHIDEDIARVI